MPHIYLFLNFYRYLLQLFLEGSCLGWAAVVATVLRDAAAMARTVRTAHAPMQTFDSIINLRDGLLTLTKWSQSEWYAYIIIFIQFIFISIIATYPNTTVFEIWRINNLK